MSKVLLVIDVQNIYTNKKSETKESVLGDALLVFHALNHPPYLGISKNTIRGGYGLVLIGVFCSLKKMIEYRLIITLSNELSKNVYFELGQIHNFPLLNFGCILTWKKFNSILLYRCNIFQ